MRGGGETAGSFVSCQRKFSTTSIMSSTAQPWAVRLSSHTTVFSCVLLFSLPSPSPCISLVLYSIPNLYLFCYLTLCFCSIVTLLYLCYSAYQSHLPTQILFVVIYIFPIAFMCWMKHKNTCALLYFKTVFGLGMMHPMTTRCDLWLNAAMRFFSYHLTKKTQLKMRKLLRIPKGLYNNNPF